MQPTTYLNFNGNCEEALRFYQRVLGGHIECLIPYEGTPAAQCAPADCRGKVLHGRLNVEGRVIMASDCAEDRYQKPQGFSICLGSKDAAEAEAVFHALAEGGTVCLPIQETFWAVRFGMLTDRFGIPWMVNCEKHVETPNEEKEGVYAARN